jgi:hypothetical protein
MESGDLDESSRGARFIHELQVFLMSDRRRPYWSGVHFTFFVYDSGEYLKLDD